MIPNFYNLKIIDFQKDFICLPADKRLNYFYDEIHLNHLGHDIMSKLLIKKIMKMNFNKKRALNFSDSEFDVLIENVMKAIQPFLDIAYKKSLQLKFNQTNSISVPEDRYPKSIIN